MSIDDIEQSEPCEMCGKRINSEMPIQIGDPIICEFCADELEEEVQGIVAAMSLKEESPI